MLARQSFLSLALCGLVLGLPPGATAGEYPPVPVLPSGLVAALQEMVMDVKADGQFDYARYRFVAPGLAPEPDFETLSADLDFLCTQYALPQLTADGAAYDLIVISIADRETEFGVANPDATQFFELYRAEGEACIWEEF